MNSGSDVLTFTNFTLSIVDYLIIIALVFALRMRLKSEVGAAVIPMERGRVHAKVGTLILLFVGFLGVVTATGALFHALDINGGLRFIVQVLAVATRVAILVVLVAWVLYTLEANLRGRWPKVDRFIERVLRSG
jgi:hypothetical protein